MCFRCIFHHWNTIYYSNIFDIFYLIISKLTVYNILLQKFFFRFKFLKKRRVIVKSKFKSIKKQTHNINFLIDYILKILKYLFYYRDFELIINFIETIDTTLTYFIFEVSLYYSFLSLFLLIILLKVILKYKYYLTNRTTN